MPVPGTQQETADFLTTLAGSPPVETHISAVFRGTDTVWKLKKAVRLGFLDFTSLEARQHFLNREVELNAPFVPGMYRDVIAVTRDGGRLTLGGSGPALDYVLRMAPVPPGHFLDAMAASGQLEPRLLVASADAVAAMHAGQSPCGAPDPAARMLAVARENAAAARDAGLPEPAVAAWEAAIEAALHHAAPALAARSPLVRRAHGDLHLGNLVLWNGQPAPCDALEFDDALATIDPGYDLAFLLMDLEQRLSRPAANLVLSRYVARTGDAGLLAPLAPFLSLRAMIRAHVAAAKGDGSAALLQAASAYLAPSRPIVLAIGGLMATGKSTLARAIAHGLGAAPGALVLRSDEVRKRLFGAAPEQPLPDHAYGPEPDRRVEAALRDATRIAVAAGHSAVVDATFREPGLRRAVAEAAGPSFLGIWLEAPLPELERRLLARRDDASDATIEVLRAAAAAPPPPDWQRLDASDAAALQEQVQQRLAMV